MKKPNYCKTIFRKTLDFFEMGEDFASGKSEYFRVYQWHYRIRIKVAKYCDGKKDNANYEDYDYILSYFLAIYLEIDEKGKFSDEKPFKDFSHFLNACFHNILPPETKTGKRYKKTISSNEMSFFLRFFKDDSEVTKRLGYRLTKKQTDGVERLIADTTSTPEERFQKLISLFHTHKN